MSLQNRGAVPKGFPGFSAFGSIPGRVPERSGPKRSRARRTAGSAGNLARIDRIQFASRGLNYFCDCRLEKAALREAEGQRVETLKGGPGGPPF